MSPDTIPTAFYVDDDGAEYALEFIEKNQSITPYVRIHYVGADHDEPTGSFWTTTDRIVVRPVPVVRRYAVTLRHDDGEITITTSARTAETAVRIVCAAENAPWRAATDVREVSA